MSSTDHLPELLQQITSQLSWGPAKQWTNQDFTTLSENIADATSVHLSPTTLKRVWGRVNYTSKPSQTTLDALAVFAGFAHYRDFRASTTVVAEVKEEAIPTPPTEARPLRRIAKNPARLYLYYLLPLAALALVIALLSSGTSSSPFGSALELPAAAAKDINPEDYRFSFRPVTSGVPNSVIFNYDASAAPNDSVFLQQNWDSRRRVQIPKDKDTYTSIYYLPGFFNAKLLVGEQIVQARDVYIRSDDWVVAVGREPVPIYLPLDEVRHDGKLSVTEAQLRSLDVAMQPTPPNTVFTNVGRTEGLFSNDFSFSTRLRHDYKAGAAACQQTRVLILLKNSAIIIPLSRPGCIAELSLFAGNKSFNGTNTDLSAFGAIGDTYLELSCIGKDDLLTIAINGKPIFSVESDEEVREIIGIRYEFAGTGSVEELSFKNATGLVWEDLF